MEQVLKEIVRMGCYDPYIIKMDKRFFKLNGYGVHCVAGIELDKDIFNEGRERQHPNMNSYFKIKPVWCKIKHVKLEITN